MSNVIADFQASFNGLVLDTEGLAPRENPLPKLERIAELALAVIAITKSPVTPEDMLAHRLAVLTKKLLTTALFHGSPQLVKSWMLARAELLELQTYNRPAMESGNRPETDLE